VEVTPIPEGTTRLSVLLPVNNDAPSVSVMARILSAMIEVPHELIVVYDDPADDAVPVLERLAPRYPQLRGILNTGGSGVLPAIRAAISAAKGEYVMIYAADEIGPVLAIERMLQLMDAGCDFVSATRYRSGGRRYGGSFLGHVFSSTANAVFFLLSASALTDCTTGIKMFRRELFSLFDLQSGDRGWSFAFEMAIKAQILGLALGEVPIVSIDRLFGGRSTFKPLPWIVGYLRWFVWGLRALPPWRRPRPQLSFPVVRRP
jgi:dolichol-phosphate mannosyltransferase